MVTIKQWKNYFLFTVASLLMLLLSVTIFQVLPSNLDSSAESKSIIVTARTIAVDGENSYTLGANGQGIGGFAMTIVYYDSSSNEIATPSESEYDNSSTITLTTSVSNNTESSQQTLNPSTFFDTTVVALLLPGFTAMTVMGAIDFNTYTAGLGLTFMAMCNRTFNGRTYILTGLSRYSLTSSFDNTEATTIIPSNAELFGNDVAGLCVSPNDNIYTSPTDSNLINEMKNNSSTFLIKLYNVVYRAQYNISYSDGTSDTYLAGVAKTLKTAPTAPSGYYSNGWKDSDTGKTLGTTISTSNANKDYNLEPNYVANSYTLHFDNLQDGNLSTAQDIPATYNSQFTFPTATRTGYTLTGWRCTSNGITYTPGTTYTIPNFGSNGTTVNFEAVWTANTYTVTFDDQGGVTNFVDLANTRNGTVTVSGSTYTLTVSGLTYTYNTATQILTVNGTQTGEARFSYVLLDDFVEGDKYRVEIEYISGTPFTGNGCQVLEVFNSSNTTLSTRNHLDYQFPTSGTYSTELTISETGETDGYALVSRMWRNTENRVFNNYKIKFRIVQTAGETRNKLKELVYDSVLTPVALPTRTGYNFQGYFSLPNGQGTQYYSSDGSPYNNKTMGIANNTTTLYAYWTAKTDCVLSFNANGGTVSPASRNQTFNASLGTLPVPTRTGYIFTGWYTSASRGSEVTSSTIMTSESMTIYAHWAETWAASHYSSALTQNGGYWLISDSADLARVLYLLNYTTRTDVLTMRFKLTNHIDMSAYYWEPIGTDSRAFRGEFNGQGYTIKGLHTISQSLRRDGGGDNSGLFGVTSTGAIIKNVYLEDIDIHGLDRVGAIVGYVKGTTTITAVAVEGTVTASGSNYGAIVGSSSTCTINDCLIIVDGIKGGNNNGLYSGTAAITNTLYDISGLRGRSSGTFDNWVYVTNMQYPLPKEISWIASGSEPIEDNVLALSTANNLVQCGDMEGRGWQVNNGTVAYSSEDVYEGEYSIKLTGDTSKSEQTVTTSDTYYLNSDHIYYFAIFVKSSLSSNARVDIYWPVAEPAMGAQSLTVANSWQMYSWKGSRNSFTSGEYPLRVDFDNNYQNGTMYIDNLILLDLTEIFGAGNEPDKAWIDKNLAIVSIDGITSEQYTFLSAQNLYQYGDMEGEGWTTNSSVQYSTEHVFTGDYALKLTGTSSSQEILAQTSETLELDPTHIYYVSVYGYQESKDGKESVECYWPVAEPTMGTISVGAVGEWNLYSWRATRTSFTSGSYQLRLDFNNKLCNSTFYFDNLRIIDLTATFGEGNEPDKSWLDANAYLLL